MKSLPKKPVRVLLLALTLLAGAPFGVGLAVHILPHAPSAGTCGSPYLASPDDQQSHTADYFVNENVITTTSTTVVHLGAYALQSASAPKVVGDDVLDGSYHVLPQLRDKGGTWSVPQACNASAPMRGTKSNLYDYDATWTAPTVPGSYELRVSFQFQDSTTALAFAVTYLVNMYVRGPNDPYPKFNSFIHDEVALEDGSGNQLAQNTINNAYDLEKLPGTVHLYSTYYTQGNPAPYPATQPSYMSNVMLHTLSDAPVFRNIDEGSSSGGRGGGGNGDHRIRLPCATCIPQAFLYTQYSTDKSGNTTPLNQTGSVIVQSNETHIGNPGQDYHYVARIDEPVTAWEGDPNAAPESRTYRL